MHDDDIERLFAEHAQRLYAFLTYRTGDPTTAEEIVGDTFERVIRSRRRFDRRKGSEQSWIYVIALNLLTDHRRRAGAEQRALDGVGHAADHADADDPLARIADRDELLGALDRLEPDLREVLALRYGADLRLKDIAQLTGRPLSTVHERLQRGLRRLQAEIERDDAHAPTPLVARSTNAR